jgi:hypothetical protein
VRASFPRWKLGFDNPSLTLCTGLAERQLTSLRLFPLSGHALVPPEFPHRVRPCPKGLFALHLSFLRKGSHRELNGAHIFEVDLHLFQRLSWWQWLVTSSRWIEDQAFLP